MDWMYQDRAAQNQMGEQNAEDYLLGKAID